MRSSLGHLYDAFATELSQVQFYVGIIVPRAFKQLQNNFKVKICHRNI